MGEEEEEEPETEEEGEEEEEEEEEEAASTLDETHQEGSAQHATGTTAGGCLD